MSDMTTQALNYASHGLSVIPIIPGEKFPPIKEWQNFATNDIDTIKHWWNQQYIGHGIGIAPRNLPDGRWLFVIDVDEKPEENIYGWETYRDLTDAYGPLPDSPTVHSGSGVGKHFYFAAPYEIRNGKTGRLGPGIDIRGNGGQTCAPPTIHKTGNQYTWDIEYNLDTTTIPDAPGWLLQLLKPAEPAQPTRTGKPSIWAELDNSPAGIYNRNKTWEEILYDDGWTFSHNSPDGEQHWTRPGKTAKDGTSATTGYKNLDILKVFTTSLPWLPEGTYSKFKYYANSKHQGDMSQAAKTILQEQPVTPNPDLQTPWQPPTPLQINPSNINFPIHTLPNWITSHTQQTAQNIQTPEDLPLVLALSALSVATLGNTKICYPRQNWTQPLNLYTITALPPSTGKSPAKNAIFAPLEEHEQQRIQQAQQQKLQYEQDKRILEGRRKTNEDKAIRHNSGSVEAQSAQHEAAEANQELVNLKPPSNGQLILDDTTAEALGVALQQNNGRIAIVSAEGGVFDKLAGMYNDQGATNIDIYLEAWSGGRHTVNRIKRDPIHIPSANLAIATTIQPHTLAQIGANKTFAGRGLLARFLVSYPTSNIGYRDRLRHTTHNTDTEQLYNENLTHIARTNDTTQRTITLDGPASDHFAQWDQNLEHQLQLGATLEHIPEWIGKLRANTIRIAGLLHIAWMEQTDTISLKTMQHAIEIAEYFLKHIIHIAEQWTTLEGNEHAFRVVKWIQDDKIEEFTVSELHKKFRRLFNKVEDTTPTIEFLVENNYLRPTFEGPLTVGVRGKTSPKYVCNPYIYKPEDWNTVPVVSHSRMCTAGGEEEEVVETLKRGFLAPSPLFVQNSTPPPPAYKCTNGTQLDQSTIDDKPVDNFDNLPNLDNLI
jgi:hypothetical protein